MSFSIRTSVTAAVYWAPRITERRPPRTWIFEAREVQVRIIVCVVRGPEFATLAGMRPSMLLPTSIAFITILALPRFGAAEEVSKLKISAVVGQAQSKALGSTVTPDDANTIGLTLRYRVGWGELALEVSKAEFSDYRIDRQIGVAVYKRLGSGRLAPYLQGGLGLNMSVPMEGSELRSEQIYGQIGVGLSYAVTPRVDIVGELATGRRWYQGTKGQTPILRATYIYIATPRDEEYRCGRVGLAIAF